jgi:long-chain acyl-CoA synthetase
MTIGGTASRHGLVLDDVLQRHRRLLADLPAVVCGAHRSTYAELGDRVDRLTGVLADEGVGRGDRVMWLGQNCHRLLELLLASARLGALCCPANWRWGVDETAFALDDLAPRVVVWQDTEIGATVGAARAATACSPTWIRHDEAAGLGYEARLAARPPAAHEAQRDPSAPVLVLYTAAFGGRPNGALLPHAGLIQQAAVMGILEETSPAYAYLNCGPLFHIATFTMTLATFVGGGTNVFLRRVEAEEVCRLVERERCTGAYVLGPTADEIAGLNANGRYDLRSLRVRTGVAAFDAMTSPDTSRWSARPGGYGQTETCGLVSYRALGPPPQGSHGWPSPLADLRLVDAENVEVGPREVGEIVVRGPTVMVGYWNRPELTAARQRGGWHHTGDLGRIEPDGSLTFVGPSSRIVKSASENIYPAEVEACLASHPAVAAAAVIGVPDPVWTQAVKAIVVLAPGCSATETEIVEHCRSRLASYKKPRSVVFVDALPQHGGRVDYDRLDADHGGGGYPGAASARYPDQPGMSVPASTHST